MREIRTSGSMSGEGKRDVAEWPKSPRLSSTLPLPDGSDEATRWAISSRGGSSGAWEHAAPEAVPTGFARVGWLIYSP